MATELIVSTNEEGIQIAVLEDGRLVELQQEKSDSQFAVGDIMMAKVRRLIPGLNAAFVDVGHARDGFLHYSDLGPQIQTQSEFLRQMLASRGDVVDITQLKAEPDIDKHGKMSEVLKPNQVILVQIIKEAISTKGPRLSSQLSIAGQYIILMPFSIGEDKIAVSRKIRNNKEKRDIKKFLSGICPDNYGIIVRTAAEGVEFQVIEEELKRLLAKFEGMVRNIIGSRPPKKVLTEMDRTSSVMRDMLAQGFDSVVTDNTDIHADIDKYFEENLPEKRRALQLKQPKMGLFEKYGIERQIKSAFGKTVNLANGAYLVVEHTEALHTIDVNSGSLKVNSASPEDNALRINMDAAKEIARQLRLRDMGGIIVVDFIDQRKHENRRAIHKMLKQEMDKDRAKHAILPMSRFGLIEITRQRVRPEVKIQTDEVCPSCNGTGKMGASILITDEIQNNVDYLVNKGTVKGLKLVVNPFVASYLKHGLPSIQHRWFMRYKKWIKVEADSTVGFTEVAYIASNGEELNLD